jgi:hypothetical protein
MAPALFYYRCICLNPRRFTISGCASNQASRCTTRL